MDVVERKFENNKMISAYPTSVHVKDKISYFGTDKWRVVRLLSSKLNDIV